MRSFNVLICTIFVLLLAVNTFALTASIGNARMILYPEVTPGETTVLEKSILVKNTNEIPVMITLEALPEIVEITEILDPEFVLEPGEEKDARFNLNVDQVGRFEGNIAVSFTPVDGNQGSGVGLLSNIIVIAKEAGETNTTEITNTTETNSTNPANPSDGDNANMLVGIGIVVAILAIGVVFYKFLKRGKSAKKSRKRKK